MGCKREEVYIANVLKCRPPQNRTPLPDEVTNCLPYLLSQIELIQPKVLVALGATAVRALLDVQLGITKCAVTGTPSATFPSCQPSTRLSAEEPPRRRKCGTT